MQLREVKKFEEKVFYLYQQIENELIEELSILDKLTDLNQIFKDNDLIALCRIYESYCNRDHFNSKVG
ncbi:hypothetical protein BBF96_01340 [Anoxybacter fermentans]|uniref:Uncharacterized protein n=1 Tax=Anoxybacter fermentans TaxID=1323375 RepID=A0A3Q9HNR0_9FIRM|nr:hypothetical protein [Anoxybacter fermentans]AZR72154.1 hypothetical protein BBF96_01340 [Anoxybacter fermentans]